MQSKKFNASSGDNRTASEKVKNRIFARVTIKTPSNIWNMRVRKVTATPRRRESIVDKTKKKVNKKRRNITANVVRNNKKNIVSSVRRTNRGAN